MHKLVNNTVRRCYQKLIISFVLPQTQTHRLKTTCQVTLG